MLYKESENLTDHNSCINKTICSLSYAQKNQNNYGVNTSSSLVINPNMSLNPSAWNAERGSPNCAV
jgi:hypothetical protein